MLLQLLVITTIIGLLRRGVCVRRIYGVRASFEKGCLAQHHTANKKKKKKKGQRTEYPVEYWNNLRLRSTDSARMKAFVMCIYCHLAPRPGLHAVAVRSETPPNPLFRTHTEDRRSANRLAFTDHVLSSSCYVTINQKVSPVRMCITQNSLR